MRSSVGTLLEMRPTRVRFVGGAGLKPAGFLVSLCLRQVTNLPHTICRARLLKAGNCSCPEFGMPIGFAAQNAVDRQSAFPRSVQTPFVQQSREFVRRSHHLLIILLALVTIAFSFQLFSDDEAASAQSPRTKLSSDSIRLSGCRVKLIDEVVLSSDQIGILSFVIPREGERVDENQLLAQIDDSIVRATYAIVDKQAENDVEVRYARKAGELAQVKYLRAIEANRDVPNTIPDLEIRELRLSAEKALLQFEQSQSNLLINKLKRVETKELLNKYRIAAPFTGIVRQTFKKRGESVSQGEPILELVSTDRVKVEGHLAIEDLAKIRRGSEVRIRVDLPDVDLAVEKHEFTGRLAFVDVRIEPVSRKVRIWAEVDNRNGLLMDGYPATMTIKSSTVRTTSR